MVSRDGEHDLLLSSGFLAFARHAGVLAAVEDAGLRVGAVVGTSSGALVGALWASGMPARDIATLVGGTRPWDLVALHLRPWKGLLSLDPLRAWLRERLPATFAELPRPFAVGVSARVDGAPRAFLLREGPLVDAVVASCAIPGLFVSPLEGPHGAWRDGGAADRVGFARWRDWRGDRPVLVHEVARSAGRDVALPVDVPVVRTPRSGASLWSLGDVHAQVEEARGCAGEIFVCGDALPG
jgi:predicted acylesterase/phospholipase RssA